MKKLLASFSALLLVGGLALAQPGGFGGGFPGGGFPRGDGERPQFDEEQMSKFMEQMEEMTDPVKIATKQADRLQEQLGLDEEQYKQVYKIYKQEAQVRINKMQQQMSRPGAMGFGGPPMGGPGFGGPGGGFDMTAMQTQMTDRMKAASEEARKEAEKNFDKRSKKMVKVLTPEQFNKWLQIEKQMIAPPSFEGFEMPAATEAAAEPAGPVEPTE